MSSSITIDWEPYYLSENMPWDLGKAAPPLVEWFSQHSLKNLLNPSSNTPLEILVPGCGLGHDVRALATASPESRVTGVDITALALEKAQTQFPKQSNVCYETVDVFHLPTNFNHRFDLIFEHTCYCAIPVNRRLDYVEKMANALRPGGYLLAIYFLGSLKQWEQKACTSTNVKVDSSKGPPFASTEEEINALFGRRFCLKEKQIPSSSYAHTAWKEAVYLWQLKSP